MKTVVFLYGALAAAVVLFALKAPPVYALLGVPHAIDLNTVQPFVQPEPVTISEKAAVKFKPQLHIAAGCQPYPAVNAAGEISNSIGLMGFKEGKCKGSPYGSQVYARSTWYNGVWAIAYTWFFPNDNSYLERYDWEHVVVWLNNPGTANQKLLAVSLWELHGLDYTKLVPPESFYMDMASLMLKYAMNSGFHKLTESTLKGEFQPLIMWDQLTEAARHTLNVANSSGRSMPLSGSRYMHILNNAWPWAPVE